MNDKNWRDLFIDNTPKLIRFLHLLETTVKKKLPEFYNHLENIEVYVFYLVY
jgi:hypothetical protein